MDRCRAIGAFSACFFCPLSVLSFALCSGSCSHRPMEYHHLMWIWGYTAAVVNFVARCHFCARCLKLVCLISRPNVGWLKVMISYFNGIDELFQTSQWPWIHAFDNRAASEMLISLRAKRQILLHLPLGWEIRKIQKCQKQFFLDILAKSRCIFGHNSLFQRLSKFF